MSAPSTNLSRWLYALKPASWPKLLVPALLGQAMGYCVTRDASWLGFALGLAFVGFDAAYIVLLNDFADREVDALKRRDFPSSGSAKTIPDGILSARAVLLGGLISGGAALGVALLGAVIFQRVSLVIGAVACLFLFWAYSLPPLRLNYRGGGELLEAIGVGALLVWTQAQFQAAAWWFAELWLLPGFVCLALSSAVASGLSDEVSDRRGGKRTLTTTLGNRATRRVTEALVLCAAMLWVAVLPLLQTRLPAWSFVLPLALLVLGWWRLRRISPAAVTNAFDEQRRYKSQLHRTLWASGVVWAVSLVLLGGVA